MTCGNSKFVVKEITLGGTQGPIGPIGPQGPAGPTPDTMDADQILVTNEGYTNAQEIFDDLLYVPINITSFSGGATQYELGRLLTSITFNWAINKTVTSQTLVGPAEMTPVVLTAGQRSVTVTLADLSSDAVFTLTADDGVIPVDADFNVSFVNRNYFGDVVIPGSIDSAFVLSLPSILKANRSHTYTSDAIGTQYNWYCYPTRYGTPTFYAGGFEGGYQLIQTLSFTNNYGYTEDYEIWRSDNPDIGPGLNIDVA